MHNSNSFRPHHRMVFPVAVVAVFIGAAGCRGTNPMNLFARRGAEPSAEMLAGTGPTTTYPVMPSAEATPTAIASVAGGTAVAKTTNPKPSGSPETAQVAGFGVSPGYATPASGRSPATTETANPTTKPGVSSLAGSQVSNAAAQANGIYAPPPGYGAGPISKTKPSGYAFGSSGKSPASTAPSAASTGYALSDQVSSSASATGASPPPVRAPSTTAAMTPPGTRKAEGTAGGGFQFPGSAVSNIQPPTPGKTPPPATSFVMPGAAAEPDYSTATSTPSASLAPSGTPSPSSTSLPTGYQPGSTATSSGGYPTGGEAPTSSGSFYR